MSDREFINMVINSYLSYTTDPHMTTLNNTIANRLNSIADKLEKQEKENAESKRVLGIINKHFIIKLKEEDVEGNVWGRLVSIQAREDEGTWDTTATANIVDFKEDFDSLKKWLGSKNGGINNEEDN